MENVKCHICHSVNEITSGQTAFCGLCETDLASPQKETKLLEDIDNAQYSVADKTTSPGWEAFVYLTNQRLIVVPAKLKGSGLEGMLTAAVYNRMTKKSGVISIPFANIKAVRDGKMGLLMKALIVDTTDGELVKIKVSGRSEWKEALTKAMKQ